ncbi:MAG: hypothetical protein M1828_003970 [Chrysothrix sp. TS-e1954]|nr:MAG: hypothetical protein M1828_003970 [Chrysothrix sp. TS-e1954]
MDSDAGTERFDGYEGELRLVSADLSQKLDQIQEQSGEQRKSLISQAERLLEEAKELITSMKMEKSSIPSASRSSVSKRLRDHESDIDAQSRQLSSLSSDRAQLFGSRYQDDPSGGDEQLEQRQQLLSGTDRLTRSSNRLQESQRIANETEQIGAGTLRDLAQQRETIGNTRERLLESEGYTDRSIKTLRGMARR